MRGKLFFGFLMIACLASLSCQSYTTGIQQGSGRADEGAALANLRAITKAQTAYTITNADGYGTFEQLAAGGYLDDRFKTSQPKFYGYVFTMTVSPKSGSSAASYSLNADPEPALKAAGRHFYIDSDTNKIHVNPNQTASGGDETVE